MREDAMTPKERWLAALQMQPVDRLPCWPKLSGAYPRAQCPPFSSMTLPALHDWMGSDKWEWVGGGPREVRRHTSQEVITDGHIRRTLFRTPHGELQRVERFDAGSQSWHPIAFPVRTREDLAILTAWYEDLDYAVDAEAVAKACEAYCAFGDDAVVSAGIGETPLMHFVEWEAGIEGAQYLLYDAPDDVEVLFAAEQRALVRRAEMLLETSPADLFYLIENTSTTLISPAQFRRYCLEHIGEIARLTCSAGKRLALHMCGHLQALLPDLATLPVVAFEAFTSPTLGNTTLLDGRTHCPDVCLIGGTNAMLWTRPAAEIIAGIEEALDALPHHRGIVVTSAGVMPPLCAPETIREVCAWVRQYPARMEVPV